MKKLKSTINNLIVSLDDSPVVDEACSFLDVINIISSYGYGVALVKDSSNLIVGLITDGDIRRTLVKHGPLPLFGKFAKDICSTEFIRCLENDSLEKVLYIMEQERRVYTLPVQDTSGKIKGLVTMHNLVTFLLAKE